MHGREKREVALAVGGGFALVRGFLWWMLAVFAALVAVAGFLSWHFGMDLSVTAQGQIRPAQRLSVKAAIGGIVREVRVREGQRVAAGETLAVVDDAEWRLQWSKLERDLRANRLQVAAIEAEYGQERRRRQLEEERTRAEWTRSKLGLERVRAEQQTGSLGVLAHYGWKRRPLAELWPVRQAAAVVGTRRAEWAAAVERLESVAGLLRELEPLEVAHAALLQDEVYLRGQLARAAVCAPDAGVVLTRGVEKRRGDFIGAGAVLLELAGGGWLAEVAVAERELPKVAVGQWARLYVEAYPHMEHKIFDGAVRAVAADRAPGGGYAVEVGLEDAGLAAGAYRLAPGMAVEARIVVERGRIAELAWARILRSLGKVHKGNIYAAGRAALPDYATYYSADNAHLKME